MKTHYLVAIALAMLCAVSSFGQGQYDLQFNVKEINCDQNYVLVGLDIKASNANTGFHITSSNFRFDYDANTLANPTIENEGVLSGFVQQSNPQTASIYNRHKLTGSFTGMVSYNMPFGGGFGYYLNDTDWTEIGTVRFDLLDDAGCFGLNYHDNTPAEFPNTLVGAKDNGSYYITAPGTLDDINPCASDVCTPPVSDPGYVVRFVPSGTDCDNDKQRVIVEIKASAPGADFYLTYMNFRFSYDPTALANVQVYQELELSGLSQTTSPSSFTVWNPHSTNGSIGGLASYNIAMAGGSGYPINNTDWLQVGELEFDILDYSKCTDLSWNDAYSYPPTVIAGTQNPGGNMSWIKDGQYEDLSNLCANCAPTREPLYNISVSPVPTVEEFNVYFTSEEAADAEFVVLDALGRVVIQRTQHVYQGANHIPFNIQNQSPGVYFLHVRFGDFRYSHKILKTGF